MKQVPIIIIRKIKKSLGVKTYHIEMAFVAVVLVAVALITHKGIVEWIGVVAVLLNFGHISVADRLKEQEELREIRNEKVTVECYRKLDYYYFSKEIFWLAYFILLGAWSALAGIALFLLYRPWRAYWRTYNRL